MQRSLYWGNWQSTLPRHSVAGGQALQAEPLRATRRCRPRTPVTCYIHKIRHVMICKFGQRPQVQASNENEIGLMSGRLVKRLAYRRMLKEMKEGDDSVRSLMRRPEVNFLVVNSATFLEIGNFRFIRQFSEFSAHFLLPAWAGQLAHFCKSEIFV